MERLESLDEDTPIEAYPGFLGYFWDHELVTVDAELQFLKEFDWKRYFEKLQTAPERIINLNLSTGPISITVSDDTWFADILAQIPSVKMTADVPANQGPGGGVAHDFFIADGSDYKSAVNDIRILIEGLNDDIADL